MTLDDVIRRLAKLSSMDLEMVSGLIDHLLSGVSGEERSPDDPELYWGVITGDDAWKQKAAEPVWAQLAEAQKKPSENWRLMAECKKRLRVLGQI